jgi:hypothetical protein
MQKIYWLLLLFVSLACTSRAQDFSGAWTGELRQNGKPDVFEYRIDLTQKGNKVEGFATSKGKDGTVARFEIGGVWNGQHLAIQEVDQLEPPNARWCLKHIRLSFSEKNGIATLAGNWEAQGCTPGTLTLSRQTSSNQIENGTPSSLPDKSGQAIPHPSSLITGKWSGHLSQSDRDYGFYFEMKFEEGGSGTSHITSDGEGGNAVHRLRWTFDEAAGRLDFEELELIEESVPSWRWCMKSGSLFFKKEESRLSLKGDWKGYIEGFDLQSGPCAPGYLYVEKPVFKQEELVQRPADSPPSALPAKPIGVTDYEKKTKRDVEVERVLEVKNRTIRIRVWDNGTIDGDICTLFLNGEMILKNYRVTRNKHETIVKLEKPVNYLILHAINTGSISPNTVAVSVDDGTQEQVVIVSSNLKTSGAVMIREFTVGE